MSLSNLAYIRLRLSIPHRLVLREDLGVGDGTTKKYQTQLWPIIAETETIRVDGVEQTRTTDYTIDNDTGLVTFNVAPATDDVIDADYKWSVFSDVQVNGLLARYNDQVIPVLKDLVDALLANSDLFIKYTTGMESVDRAKALDALRALRDSLDKIPTGTVLEAIVWTEEDIKTYERDVPWSTFID